MPIICAQFCFLKLTIQISFLISGRCCFLSRKEAGFPENDNSKELIWILAPPPFSFQSPCHNLAFSQHYQSSIVFRVQIWGWGLHILKPLPYGVFSVCYLCLLLCNINWGVATTRCLLMCSCAICVWCWGIIFCVCQTLVLGDKCFVLSRYWSITACDVGQHAPPD